MLSFENDYSQGAHEKILQRLIETNMDAQTGYGFDEYTESAKARIRETCGCADAEIHFLVGGTQTNQTGACSAYAAYRWSHGNHEARICRDYTNKETNLHNAIRLHLHKNTGYFFIKIHHIIIYTFCQAGGQSSQS